MKKEKAEIYYFSGTGNSLFVARDIAAKITAELKSIPSFNHLKSIKTDADIIGFVFPDYHSDLPNILKRFINKFHTFENKYIFGITTYGGAAPGITIKHLKESIESKGGKLSAGFTVKMPYNYIIPSFSFKEKRFIIKLKTCAGKEQDQLFKKWKSRLKEITAFIRDKKEGVYENTSEFLFKIVYFLKLKESFGKETWLKMAGYKEKTKLSFSESRQLMDHAFYPDENCIGCKTCAKVCPVENIKMIKNKPSWKHKCEQCFACLQWCPKSAIQFGKDTAGEKRYHHPAIKVKELFL
jgi:ferredoxin